ncbi:hypothetical protein SAMN05421504_101747 [Amycolatopsis xylanica]|uniref:Uncharacterized protein n=1 Tax=Amycolatopsis xylanica TaxID=589385 RepID=A0A1H2U0H2_9PSEU|nr:hypothetical protein [Amycolatopsis xylanica]SDW49676.1 hypothetical protein SAMN05421504_101747 [Amycolatopsis xylanica]
MSHPEVPEPSLPQTTQPRQGHGLLSFAILVAGLGGGLLAWHPWVTPPAPEPPKDPHHITIQHIGDQEDVTNSSASQPVYCMTNETGGLYCMVMPNHNTDIRERK